MNATAPRRLAPLALLPLLLGWVACATPPPPASPDALKPPPRRVEYNLDLHERHAVVRLTVRRPGGDPIALTMEPWQGGSPATDLYDLHATTREGGAPLEVRQEAPGRWVVAGAGDRDFEVRYVVVGRQGEGIEALQDGGASSARPWTAQAGFMAWGRAIFPTVSVPQGAPGWDERWIKLSAPEGWTTTTTWGRNFTSVERDSDLLDALVLAGPSWQVRGEKLGGANVRMALAGQWTAPAERVREQVRRLVELHCDVYGGYPRYGGVIAVVPVPREQAGVLAIPGGALFALPPDVDLVADAELLTHVARQHLQMWLGHRAQPRLEDVPGSPYRPGHVAWFTEGALEWLSVRTAMKMGAMDIDAFMPLLNGWIKKYFANPNALNLPRAMTLTGYQDDPYLQDLARAKGALLALLMDVRLRADSQGLQRLDLVLRKIDQRFQGAAQGYSTDDIRAMVEELSGESWEEFFTLFVDGIEPLPLPDLARGGVIVLDLPFPVFDLGFQVPEGPIDGATVLSVDPNSEAAHAGLLAGDIVRELIMGDGEQGAGGGEGDEDPDMVTLIVDRAGRKKPFKIKYLPMRDMEIPIATEMTDLFSDWFR